MDSAWLVRWAKEEDDHILGSRNVSPSKAVFTKACWESKKLWYLAGPSVLIAVFQFGLFAVTETFSGQLSAVDRAAWENLVICGIGYGLLVMISSSNFSARFFQHQFNT